MSDDSQDRNCSQSKTITSSELTLRPILKKAALFLKLSVSASQQSPSGRPNATFRSTTLWTVPFWVMLPLQQTFTWSFYATFFFTWINKSFIFILPSLSVIWFAYQEAQQNNSFANSSVCIYSRSTPSREYFRVTTRASLSIQLQTTVWTKWFIRKCLKRLTVAVRSMRNIGKQWEKSSAWGVMKSLMLDVRSTVAGANRPRAAEHKARQLKIPNIKSSCSCVTLMNTGLSLTFTVKTTAINIYWPKRRSHRFHYSCFEKAIKYDISWLQMQLRLRRLIRQV